MLTKHHKKSEITRIVLRAISIASIIYFGNHAIRGDYGLYATEILKKRLTEYESSLSELRKTRAKLEHKVKLLSDGSLERDMLDEKARYNLNLSRSDEIILFDSYF
ncbi:septum formation initiator family protein [Candidatus Liberibacter sp.]|uniref:FtsB family cell division protein n=1 Tax=Candidatus Liberibacter sp. TaxID=34022 RepID=UPI0015F403B1|nr:septum formation initiator family protein [Candidatus Liberibacter sp.]MBA5723799.1 septum formation initiator family protein [Candidatus Liberibacter sp.]